MANPFQFGAPVDAAHFTDRQDELERISALMLNSQNLFLIAPRRYGKTSLLERAVDRVRAQGGRTGRVSLITCSNPQEVVQALLTGVVEGPLGWLRGHFVELGQWLRRIRVAPEIHVDAMTGKQSVVFGPRLSESNWRQVMSEVIHILGDLAASDAQHPVSLVIDEFQKGYEISPLIADIFKDLIDELADVGFVFSGSKRHIMESMVNDPDHGALYNVGDKMYLGKIGVEDFVPFLQERAATGGKAMSREAADRIYEAAAGIPNQVQLLAFWAFHLSAEEISEEMVDIALVAAVRDRADEFIAIYERLPYVQQRLLKLLARGPVHAVTGRAVQMTIDTSSRGAHDAALGLERAQLAERSGGTWTIADGLMGEWLRTVD